MFEETIVAPITAIGRGAVALVRISGPQTRTILVNLIPAAEEVLNEPRKLFLRTVFDHCARTNLEKEAEPTQLDHGLVSFFAAPASYTGEDVCEFHLHGSPFLVERLIKNCLHFGARLANSGEFSQRAFLNGKLDLSQAEAISDLISAETEAQAHVAREQLEGKLSRAISEVGEPIRNLISEIEAAIDFPEEDIEVSTGHVWARTISATKEEIERYLASYRTGKIYRDGASVALIGPTNAGKSSLLNRFVGEERAIVTPTPGTTRDSIEERVSWAGFYIRLWDTAGLLEHDNRRIVDEVETLGIDRSWKRLELADVVLLVLDGARELSRQMTLLQQVKQLAKALIILVNKADLLGEEERAKQEREIALLTNLPQPLFVSAQSGVGLLAVQEKIIDHLLKDTRFHSTRVLICNSRHEEALQRAKSSLEDALQVIAAERAPELIVIDLRAALAALSDIIGVTYTEDILGRIFSKFCIGK